MVRKSISIVILISLMLHCAGRMGFLSYLYKQRHEIAYTLGVIDEVPIALCSSSYFTHERGLEIQSTDDGETVPSVLTAAVEIVLFFDAHTTIATPALLVLCEDLHARYISFRYHSPDLDFFQPPRI